MSKPKPRSEQAENIQPPLPGFGIDFTASEQTDSRAPVPSREYLEFLARTGGVVQPSPDLGPAQRAELDRKAGLGYDDFDAWDQRI